MRRISRVLLFAVLAGCIRSEATLDTTNDQTMQQSIAALTEGMSEDDKATFRRAIMSQAFKSGMLGLEMKEARKELHGLTAEELFERLRKQLQQQIDELEEREPAAAEAKAALQSFRVIESNFYFSESIMGSEATIKMKVQNGTRHAVSRVYFQAKLISPGRSVPWVEDGFNYPIPGGLEPGEEATWELAPGFFGEWSKAPKDRTDMVLVVTPTRIDGADGKALFGSDIFSEADAARLARLRKELEEIPNSRR